MVGKDLLVLTHVFLDNSHCTNHLRCSLPFLCKIQAKQSLSDMCFGKQARVESSGIDRYGRTLGRVYCAGVDSNAEQVKRGMAWVYDRYVKDRSLYAVQESARGARVGLWADVNPIPPWEFRRASKKGN